MTNQVPSSSDSASQLPTVPNNSQQVGPIGLPVGMAPWSDNENKKEGFDVGAFMHSLRRRWIIGLGIGFLVASVLAGMLWLFVPIEEEAFVIYRIRRQEANAIRKNSKRGSVGDFELFKKTQADLFKSQFVIGSALRKPTIANLPIVRENAWKQKREKPDAWLEKELNVNSPEGTEVLIISLRERDGEQVKQLLDALSQAYNEEIITNERQLQTQNLNRLRDRERRVKEDIKDKLDEMKLLGENVGSMQSDQNKLQIDLEFQKLRALESDRQVLEREIRSLQTDYFLVQQRYTQALRYKPRDWEVEDALMAVKPDYRLLGEMVLEMKTRNQLGGGQMMGGGQSMARLQADMERIKQESRKEVADRLAIAHGHDLQELRTQMQGYQATIQRYAGMHQALSVQYKEAADRVRSMGVSNADLQILELEVVSLNKLSDELKQEIGAVELEMAQNNQIQLLQSAHIPAESSWLTKYMQITGVWVMALMMTLFGIALWDFKSKRINSTKDVIDNGDLRVLGTLPPLNGRRAGGLLQMNENMRQSIELGLARSIDSIRTSLLYGKLSESVDVVMVSSPLGQEGKSTVASQLAVSMARSGRRTLLIDGDLRNPQQHVVLGLPFTHGLCELIRSDVALEDVVRATPAEGLWHLCAGYRDQQTDQYLASPALGKIFEDLKSRFDMIIVDTGPVLTSPDAMLLGQHADVAILSVRRDISRLPKVKDAADRLRTVGVRVAGAVINGVSMDLRLNELQSDVGQPSTDPRLEKAAPVAAGAVDDAFESPEETSFNEENE